MFCSSFVFCIMHHFALAKLLLGTVLYYTALIYLIHTSTVPFPQDGRPDRSFFSADCFHLSQKAQTLMARSLWNNMVSI